MCRSGRNAPPPLSDVRIGDAVRTPSVGALQTERGKLTLERDAEQTPLLVAAPRHLRRRRFRADVPDPLLVPDAVPYRQPTSASNARSAKRTTKNSPTSEITYRRKRIVALLLLSAVSLSIPVLVVALVLAG